MFLVSCLIIGGAAGVAANEYWSFQRMPASEVESQVESDLSFPYQENLVLGFSKLEHVTFVTDNTVPDIQLQLSYLPSTQFRLEDEPYQLARPTEALPGITPTPLVQGQIKHIFFSSKTYGWQQWQQLLADLHAKRIVRYDGDAYTIQVVASQQHIEQLNQNYEQWRSFVQTQAYEENLE